MKDKNGALHDKAGRFTSEQSERRKTMNREYMEKHFPAYTEAQKAMKGETITQTLGKKQAEINRNTAHVVTNGEKYRKYTMEDMLKHRVILDLERDLTVDDMIEWFNEPAEQDWPEWVKVGAWVANCFGKEPIFRKIESISANHLHFADGWNAEFEHVSEDYYPARVRPFTAKEAVDLWHKTIVHIGVKQYIKEVRIMDSGEPCVVWSSGWAMACQIAIDSTFEDGSPCGVLEVVE